MSKDYVRLNAEMSLKVDGSYQYSRENLALRSYFLDEINPRSMFVETTREKLQNLTDGGYYEKEVIFHEDYGLDKCVEFFDFAAKYKHRFESLLGAYKFYNSYALRSDDGETILERFSDRCAMVALSMALHVRGSAEDRWKMAYHFLEEMMSGRLQPATPTFANAGKVARGELVSCFLLSVSDNMESIGRVVNDCLALSKRGGGVAIDMSNLRESGAPIKGRLGQSSGVVPVMKLLEDSFSYANQLGTRDGAGAVYLSVFHPDIVKFLDTKKENADEKTRIANLSLGVVMHDKFFELARRGDQMLLFSPYDVERETGEQFSGIDMTSMYEELASNPRIKKYAIDPRDVLKKICTIKFESGYPYLMFFDAVNKGHALKGKVTKSNLCTEILQESQPSTFFESGQYENIGQDISCNLASMNIAKVVASEDIESSVERAVRFLTAVSDSSSIEAVPSIKRGNEAKHAVGLGQMNLQGFLASEGIVYGSPEALDFVNVYMSIVTYAAYKTSNDLAKERGESFEGFEHSRYADGSYFRDMLGDSGEDWMPQTSRVKSLCVKYHIRPRCRAEWEALSRSIQEHGLYNAYLQAIAPNGSTAYLASATNSIAPVSALVESRVEGSTGRTYFKPALLNETTEKFFISAYDVGNRAIIETAATAQRWVDQGISTNLFYWRTDDDGTPVTTRTLSRDILYAWKRGLKTLYYTRFQRRDDIVFGEEVAECESCMV